MRKPSPEDFGLSSNEVHSLTEEKSLRDKRRESFCLWPCVVIGISSGIVFYISKLPHLPERPIEVFGIFLTSLWFGAIGFAAGLIAGYQVLRIVNSILPERSKYKALNRYRQGLAKYDEWFLRTQEAFWNSLDGRRFEVEVTNLLTRAGYKPTISPAGGDGGVDIILNDRTIVQCKAHRTPASPSVVRDLYGTLTHQKAPRAILISLNGVTDGVRKFIVGKPITVWDRSSLIALQKSLAD